MNIDGRPRTIALIAAACVLADWYLVHSLWMLDDRSLFAVTAIPMSQCSLLAIWASLTRRNPILRFLVPLILIPAVWFLLTEMLLGFSNDPAAYAWAASFFAQTLGIVLTIKVAQWLTARRGRENGVPENRFAFDIRSLMLWTMALALSAAFVRYGYSHSKWQVGFEDGLLRATVGIGVWNAIIATACVWPFTSSRWKARAAKLAGTILLVIGSSLALAKLVSDIEAAEALLLAGVHCLVVIAAIAVTQRAGST